MAGYKYRIVKEETGYHYALLPNNSNVQEVAYSVDGFVDLLTCREALIKMKSKIEKSKSTSIRVDENKQENNKWYPVLYINNKAVLCRRIGYCQKFSCDAWKNRILKNYDAELK